MSFRPTGEIYTYADEMRNCLCMDFSLSLEMTSLINTITAVYFSQTPESSPNSYPLPATLQTYCLQ